MTKRNVIAFFSMLLFLAVVLFVLQFMRFGSITGFTSEKKWEEQGNINKLQIQITEAEREGGFISLKYVIKAPKNLPDQMTLGYNIYDSYGLNVKEGNMDIIVRPGMKQNKSFVFLFPINRKDFQPL